MSDCNHIEIQSSIEKKKQKKQLFLILKHFSVIWKLTCSLDRLKLYFQLMDDYQINL